MREVAEFLIRTVRYPLWVVVASVSAIALVSSFTDVYGQVAAVLGVLAGGVLGELVGRSRMRLPWVLASSLAGVIGLLVTDHVLVDWWLVALSDSLKQRLLCCLHCCSQPLEKPSKPTHVLTTIACSPGSCCIVVQVEVNGLSPVCEAPLSSPLLFLSFHHLG